MSPLAAIRKIPPAPVELFGLWFYDAFDGWCPIPILVGAKSEEHPVGEYAMSAPRSVCEAHLAHEHERSGRAADLGTSSVNSMGEHYGILPADHAYIDTAKRRGR